MMPETVSTYGPAIDQLYYVILVITGVVFFLTEGALIAFLVMYRHKEGRKAAYIHGSTKAEVVWTVVPFLIVMAIALASKSSWDLVKNPANFPADAMRLVVTAKQFEWNVTYPGADGRIGTADDFTVRNQLHIPVNRAVRVNLRAEDVIHSFFLPEFRLKQDAIPGREIPVWFEATRTGEFTLGCAELCGLGHYRMKGTVYVHTEADFQSWAASRAEEQQQ
ncbi:MAG: cytochrome c oxidase subunit II [Gemmatimonadetes bacterium]|nr:cytochrome c oxidase subunit II [Gemmatimonadota bacterium]